MCTTPNLHRNSSLSRPCGPLSAVHKGLHMYRTAAECHWSLIGWSPSKVQLPVGVPERTGKHHGRCAELNHYLPQPRAMQSILNGVALGAIHRAEGYDPAVVEGDDGIWKEVHVATGWVLVELHMTDWAKTHREDPVLNAVLNWLEAQKKTDLKTLLEEHASHKEGWLVWRNCQNFTIHQKALYICSMPKGKNEDLLLFMVPRVHRVATLNGCHWDAGHQDHDHTLSLL